MIDVDMINAAIAADGYNEYLRLTQQPHTATRQLAPATDSTTQNTQDKVIMGTWIIDSDNILECDTHGNMRQYRHAGTGQIWLVRVEVFYDFGRNEQCVEVYVDGECVSSRSWELYRSGKMYAHQLPFGWGLSNGFDIGWRNVKKQVKASA